jgi:hypothetical protein
MCNGARSPTTICVMVPLRLQGKKPSKNTAYHHNKPSYGGGQMTSLSSGDMRISWGKEHVISTHRIYFLMKALRMEFAI